MNTINKLRARTTTKNGTAFKRHAFTGNSSRLNTIHSRRSPVKPSNGRIGTHRNKAAWKFDFSGVWAFLQYLLSLLAGNSPPPPLPLAAPRLVLLANNSFDAKCLDGSPPGYYFRAGTGGGKNMWLIYLPGGGWCGTAAQCVARSKTLYGTSTLYPTDPEPNAALRPPFNGILSSNSTINPPFYNWNLVRLIYCDGCGYSGTAGRLEADSNGTVLYLDGRNIVQAVIEDLKAKGGITSAAQILLSGSSAGGQAVVSLCDRIAAAFPWAPTKCIADAGFFIDSKDRVGGYTWRNTVKDVVALHKPSWPICQDALPEADQWKCFFPQYTLQDVTTPIFIFHTFFDIIASQIGGLLPWNNKYALACLGEIMRIRDVTGIIQRKEWSKIQWWTKYCTAGERDALFVAASVLNDELESFIESRDTVVAFVPAGAGHSVLYSNTWMNPWIRGMSVGSQIVEWLAGRTANRFVHM